VFIPWCDDDHGSAYSIRASRTFRSDYFTNNQDDEAIIRLGFTHRELGEAIMTKLITAAFIASASLAVTASAQAMPIAPLGQPDVGVVVQVFGGCGWDGHRGPFGGCRPLYNCPPGWHTGPWGRVCTPVYPVGPAPVYPVGPAPVYPVGPPPQPVYPGGDNGPPPAGPACGCDGSPPPLQGPPVGQPWRGRGS
jgi:hypothetical protein